MYDLLLDGPLLRVEITVPLPFVSYLRKNNLPPYAVAQGLGQIDTGAAVSAVDSSIFTELDIPSANKELIQTAHGLSMLECYNASVTFPQLDLPAMDLDLVIGGHIQARTSSGPDIIMLIGRDLLRHFTFTYDGPNARFTVLT
jgi:hypothetical protein